ncbi:MAG: VWA domain-containing protein, partial [Pyrinomonadaceae bacterium]|nr:VWA domain-containing protein [Pyrinomonadaceae bacterium]
MKNQSINPADAKRVAAYLLSALCIVVLSFAVAAQQSQDDDDEVVRINTDLVVMNVTVVDGQGKYVHGLKRSDFKVFEDGREQPAEIISTFSTEETPFAAVILLDASGSMESRMTLARSAAIRFLDGLRPDDVAAVYKFDAEIEKVQDFSPSRDLASMAFGIRARGMTSLNDAIVRAAQDLAERPEKRRAIVVLSDGMDTRSRASAEKALNQALDAQATIYTVDMSASHGSSVGNQQNAAVLRNFAAKSGGRFVATPGGQALR